MAATAGIKLRCSLMNQIQTKCYGTELTEIQRTKFKIVFSSPFILFFNINQYEILVEAFIFKT